MPAINEITRKVASDNPAFKLKVVKTMHTIRQIGYLLTGRMHLKEHLFFAEAIRFKPCNILDQGGYAIAASLATGISGAASSY